MPQDLIAIKSLLDDNLGESVVVTVQLGRNKKRERRGILKETHRSVFVVDLDQDTSALERVSYSYSDVLTNVIEVSFA
ncbi:Veg family protein [Aerococcaceae bacterium NML191292]|nr:Veg family protein [Aerococcaceae bacterium NML210727]MCW6655132.1 Veg family protein [Aerococcaceae bacterium NML201296]MCW6660344.1 Veg family protein [Aerococcaceae bacterium NML191292]MCW6661586.1 Veg family protein [Aerococcaceae bacterium NML201209]MCW6663748.1 Veg family protein [Aerococcaceae bacterium NML190073]MCW6665552.1 Veg family protein [Aerococcaceae bacterium NML191219]MCW6666899.1 Veg family protein [Aerococcaceae bacterium NML190938]MCW6674918.1 Veg family protein [Aero